MPPAKGMASSADFSVISHEKIKAMQVRIAFYRKQDFSTRTLLGKLPATQ
jgi:hypothetical protein